MTDEELADIGEKMLDVLDRFGWCKGTLQNDQGQVCLRGAAIAAITNEDEVAWPFSVDLLDEIDRRLDAQARRDYPDAEWVTVKTGYVVKTGCAHVRLNNAWSTTEEDVKLLIKRALIEPSLGGTE